MTTNPEGIPLGGRFCWKRSARKSSLTEASAKYENGRISGTEGGIGEEIIIDLQRSITEIDHKIQEVNENYSGGKRHELAQKIEELEKQKEDQEQARKYMAFTLASKISNLQTQLEDLPMDLITSVDNLIQTYQQRQSDLENRQNQLEQNQEKSKNYLWLESTVAEYQKLILTGTISNSRIGVIWLVLSMVAAALAVLLVFIRQPYVGVGMILLAVVFGFLHLRSLKRSLTNATLIGEIEKIAKDYQERFAEDRPWSKRLPWSLNKKNCNRHILLLIN